MDSASGRSQGAKTTTSVQQSQNTKTTTNIQQSQSTKTTTNTQQSQGAKTTSAQQSQGANATTSAQHRPLHRSDRSDDGPSTESWARWSVFLAIFISLLVGLAFALGHHAMNNHLNGKPVGSISVSQSWIFRFGTAFAFLVKVAFAMSVAASYVQYQWLKFRRQSFRMDEIDSLTAVLENVVYFLSTRVFLRQPVLLLVAIVSWTIPFAAVVTPGSLTVEPARNTSTTNSRVPQPAYNSTYFGQATYSFSNGIEPLALVYKLAYNTAAAGQPVALSSEYQNESYSLTFDGPAVKCASAAESLVRNVSSQFNRYRLNTPTFYYISWVPGHMPAVSKHPLSLSSSWLEPASFEATLDEMSGDAARIFVMTNTGKWNNAITINATSYASGRNGSIPPEQIYLANVTECQLYNATYAVNFTFQYPNQTREVSISKWLNPVKPASAKYAENFYQFSNLTVSAYSSRFSYLSMMQAFGKLLVGYTYTDMNVVAPLPIYTSWEIVDIDWSKGPAVQSGLESLFQNFTLSLLSQDNFTKPKSESDPIPIKVTTYPITYTYAAYELLIPYGLAFFFALLCAVIGSYAFFVNHASYHNVFSSFVRATSGHEVHAMLGSDSNGADPLPAELAKIKISMNSAKGKPG